MIKPGGKFLDLFNWKRKPYQPWDKSCKNLRWILQLIVYNRSIRNNL